MELFFGNVRYLGTYNFVEIIDFYKPISNLYGNISIYNKIQKSQDLFLKNSKGELAKISLDELVSNENHLLGFVIFQHKSHSRDFSIYHFFIKTNTDFQEVTNHVHKNIENHDIITPVFLIKPPKLTSFPFLTFRLGRYNDGRFVVFLHPSTFENNNFETVETHEANCPGRIPAE